MGQTDISSLSAGDTFTVQDVNLQSDKTYNFVIDAGGSDFQNGFHESNTFPITSDDGQLTIEQSGIGETGTNDNDNISNLLRVGNVGF